MDYKQFFNEIAEWINQCNQTAVKHGIASEVFWAWVTSSSTEICKRYDDNPLVIKQMMMLSGWLEEVYDKSV